TKSILPMEKPYTKTLSPYTKTNKYHQHKINPKETVSETNELKDSLVFYVERSTVLWYVSEKNESKGVEHALVT
uniref:hypothetical protein n=1 Tax=Thermofilum sp. TaxID=1961369 RepID=UPI002586857A